MTKIVDQLDDCRKQLRELDEQEANLDSYYRKGRQLAEETYLDIRSVIHKLAETNEPLMIARQELEHAEAAFLEELAHKKKQVYRQREELEMAYKNLKLKSENEKLN